jgi:hypothetical protein
MLPVTPFCLLQLLRKTVLLLPAEVRIVSIDDWCWKKGTTYGTIIVDLETRQPIELLPDRSVETVKDSNISVIYCSEPTSDARPLVWNLLLSHLTDQFPFCHTALPNPLVVWLER